ncbi:MAG: aminoglycoside adenylyltransferase domain-containing protein [Gemmatimonadaceae bacterium]
MKTRIESDRATPYPELNEVLRDLVANVRHALGDSFIGAYLQGSFAVGDFDRHSDVDFVVAVSDELTADQVEALQEIHRRVYRLSSEWAKHLEGSYFPTTILRSHDQRGKPLWYLDHGSKSLVKSVHCNTVLVRWVVREQGITLSGPDPSTLVDPIPVEVLRQDIANTICNWGQQILDDPEPYRNHFYQGYIVLNYCRMLHDLAEGRPGSKRAGAEWAKATLDPKWSGLIDRAWDGRPDPAISVREPANAADFTKTLAFVRSIIREVPNYYR